MSRLPAPENPVAAVETVPVIDSEATKDSGDSKASSVELEQVARQRKTPAFVSSISTNEPIVTRRELWSYYRTFYFMPSPTMWLLMSMLIVYYNGDNVRCAAITRC